MRSRVTVRVNGTSHALDVEPRALLVDVLRDDLNLTGTHVGCDTSQCGACTVLLDGKAVKACSLFAVQADGHDVTTIEGLATAGGAQRGALHPLQEAFREHHGLQCGFCTPGMIVAAADFLTSRPRPSDAEIREGIRGNLCRCTGYHNIVEAVRAAAARLSPKAAAAPTASAVSGTRGPS